jgi:hypothetical protein
MVMDLVLLRLFEIKNIFVVQNPSPKLLTSHMNEPLFSGSKACLKVPHNNSAIYFFLENLQKKSRKSETFQNPIFQFHSTT